MSVKQMQEEYGISRTTIYNYIAEGLPHFKVGKLVRFEREVVLQWFKDRSNKQQG